MFVNNRNFQLAVIFFIFVLCGWTAFAVDGGNDTSQIGDFFWKLINLTVLIAIIYAFSKKPLSNFLRNSAESARNELEIARKAEAKISEDLKEMNAKIERLERDALKMITDAKKDGEKAKARIIEDGKIEIRRMKDQASFALKQEQRKAEDSLRRWVAEESIKLAESALREKMEHKDQNALVEKFISGISNSKGTS